MGLGFAGLSVGLCRQDRTINMCRDLDDLGRFVLAVWDAKKSTYLGSIFASKKIGKHENFPLLSPTTIIIDNSDAHFSL